LKIERNTSVKITIQEDIFKDKGFRFLSSAYIRHIPPDTSCAMNQQDFSKALKCADDLGFSVTILKDCETYFDFNKSEIIIDEDLSIEKKIFCLLHECAHGNLRSDVEIFRSRYPGRYFNKKGKAYKVSVLFEEIEAWQLARELAVKYNIKINQKSWVNFITKCVTNYAIWVAQWSENGC
jgi:hypothetical protein